MSPIALGLRGLGVGGGGSYFQKVLGTGPYAYWPLWETSGSDVHCLINPAQNGSATGVSWANTLGPDGVNGAPFFDSANDYINVFSSALASAINGSEGSLMLWHKVFNAGVWIDTVSRVGAWFRDTGFSNYFYTWKRDLNNRFRWQYSANGTIEIVERNPITTIDWFQAVITWSAAADEMKAYFNGTQEGLTQTGLGTWAGPITIALIGAGSLTPSEVWHGWLQHCALWDYVLPLSTIKALATP